MKNKIVKRIFSLITVCLVLLQMTDYTSLIKIFADEKMNENQVYIDETTDEILHMIDNGLDLDTFFEGDLVKGITKEELIRWKEEGKDIKDVINERANERTATIGSESSMLRMSKAAASGNGKYYLTTCTPTGNGYVTYDKLFNPKTGVGGRSDTWYIELGNQYAMCLSFGANASVNTTHNYIKTDIAQIKNNPYFRGGSSYPVEDYLRGACYAYEKVKGRASGQGYYTSALDADHEEMIRKLKVTYPSSYDSMIRGIVGYGDCTMLYSILQIIMWQISCGTFNPNNLDNLHNEAYWLFTQMYPEEDFGTFAAGSSFFYDYFAICAKECASGNYDKKFEGVEVTYWAVQGNNSVNWQDFVTWKTKSPVPVKDSFDIVKTGEVFNRQGNLYPNATFNIYSDSGCTYKIGEFTTDSTGSAKIEKIVEGVYYLREVKAPTGTILNNKIITLNVDDTIDSTSISNEEYYNSAIFRKYDKNTNEVITSSGKYGLYEYVNGKYMKVCDFIFKEEGYKHSEGFNVPDNSYVLDNVSMTYHNSNGTVMKTITDSYFYYTSVNEGKFKIVEEKAPLGYKIDTEGKLFSMKTGNGEQGYVHDFTSSASGIKDDAYKCGIKFKKYDTLSADELPSATFKLQEIINGNAYDVGMFVYDEEEKVYKTSSGQTYIFRNSSGSIIKSLSGTDCPVIYTTANRGRFRIVETVKPSENYNNLYTKNIIIKPEEDNFVYEYLSYDSGQGNATFNTGKKISVSVSKYDATTQELIKSSNAVITVYEYNTNTSKWYSLGELLYNEEQERYELNSKKFYTPHKADGTLSGASLGVKYNPGYLYYTSVNEGRFKIVEEKAPNNYLLGTLTPEGIKTYEKEFFISEDTEDNYVVDLTDYENAAKDTGISANLQVVKNDSITGNKVLTGNAIFTVYEQVNGKWLEVGNLIYDDTNKIYTSKGMAATFHNSNEQIIKTTTLSDHAGLTYTTANSGKFKVVETKAPTNYVNSGYEKEFSVIDDAVEGMVDMSSSADSCKDIGVSKKVQIAKYDSVTGEKVKTQNTVFTISEKIGDKWFAVGTLTYDENTDTYVCDNQKFTFRDETGKEITDTSGIKEFELGKLYYTSANKGQFKIKETVSPDNYITGYYSDNILNVYEKEFLVNEEVKEDVIDFTDYENAAKDMGISIDVQISKNDAITGSKVLTGDADIRIYEHVNGKWLEVGKLIYDDTNKIYTSKGMTATFHNSNGQAVKTIILTDKEKLAYTSANEGRFKVEEIKEPVKYQLNSNSKEFNVLNYKDSGMADFTSLENCFKDIGIYGTVNVSKYDIITSDKVEAKNTEFTIYENINGTMYKVGTLVYNEESDMYVCDNQKFTFHDETGKEITGTDEIKEFELGKLYYTSANKGEFKVEETKEPTNYLIGTFFNKFTIRNNKQVINLTDISTGAKNEGINASVRINKYDSITKLPVSTQNAVFVIEEKINDTWYNVCTLNYDEEKQYYTTDKAKITLRNKKGEIVYNKTESGKLYYTTANKGIYRIVETVAPDNYITGKVNYAKEFNVLDAVNGIIDYTTQNAAYNIGKDCIVKVAKYDSVTGEKVKTTDAEFTIYEKINDEWYECGVLVYNNDEAIYDCNGVDFEFHDEDGNILETSNIADYEAGKLYYTTANQGRFKVVETKAPTNYKLDSYIQEFTTDSEVNDFMTTKAAYDRGISGNVVLSKSDKETDELLSGAVFAVSQWSEKYNKWLYIGNLNDDGDGNYTSEDMTYIYDSLNDKQHLNGLVYTNDNNGRFRIIETKAPEGYMNDGYEHEIQIMNDNELHKLTNDDTKATDTSIKVSLSKKSITTGKDISGAKLTVKDTEGNIIDSWISDGTEHIISGIRPGKYILTEEAAPEGYIISNNIEFEVKETYEIQKVEMFDEIVRGKVIINKTDKQTGKKLSGAKFELRAEDGSLVQVLVTDENGYAESEYIDFGIYDKNGKYTGSKKYTLKEISAPSGYDTDETVRTITFEYKDDSTKIVEVICKITNNPTPPVKTGDYSTTARLILIGLFAVIILVSGVYFKFKND